MQVDLRQIYGNWDLGFALDKHMKSSVFLGNDASGHPQFDSTRTEAGEATYQLKYNNHDYSQAAPLAQAVAEHIMPRLGKVGLIIPMAASTWRPRQQPVDAVALALGEHTGIPVFPDLLLKAKGGKSLKDLKTREEKIAALVEHGFSIAKPDAITNNGKWDALLLDDLYHTGASVEAAVTVLRTHPKLGKIYVAALTWMKVKT